MHTSMIPMSVDCGERALHRILYTERILKDVNSAKGRKSRGLVTG